ncbi:hypothetical protein DT250_04245 [Bacillus sp. AR2-1]|nr:hypothetical protein [Bacillus sp. AR2-1]KAA0776192.1 hypothetical protein DT250_04245 [Bacillus sp. AR2-1]
MSNTAFSEFMEIIDVYWDDPVAFAEDMLGFYPDEWQRKVLMDLAQSPKVSVRSGQGVVGGVTDRLKEVIKSERLPFKVYPVVNNGKLLDDEHYDNAGAKGWAVVRDLLEENMKAFIQGEEPTMEIPNDEKMISQFSSRKYRITSRGKIALERKEEMKKRGLQSPDRADAIVLAFYKPKVVMGGKVKRV